MKITTTLCFCLLACFLSAQPEQPEQASARLLEYTLHAGEPLLNQPVYLDMTGTGYNEDSGRLVLYVRSGDELARVACQLEMGLTPRLWFLPGTMDQGETKEFVLFREPGTGSMVGVHAAAGPHNITITAGGKPVLKYRHSMIEAPDGTNPLYRRRGAYIHPLYSPEGQILTRIQPPDHYHHYGIWNPWTRTVFEGRNIDFWNLAAGQGTVRHAGIVSVFSGALFGGFRALHEHVDFTAPGADKTALNETWDVRSWRIGLADRELWVTDFIFTLNCATDSAVELSQYRYGGGFGLRATEEWTRENATVLTSAGKTRAGADASFARWCRLEGETGGSGRSGVVVMSHPANRAHPEPMRVWPEDAVQGRGDVFFEFCPIRHEAWILSPGREYVLQYRLIAFDGTLEKELIEQMWQNYARPPKPVVK